MGDRGAIAGCVRATPKGAPITVYLRGGEYFLSAGLVFGPSDSGVDGGVVTYAAYPGDAPAAAVLHNGVRVTGWALADAARGIWAAPLPPGVADARQAYINGARMEATNTGGGLSHASLWAHGYTTTDALPDLVGPNQGAVDIELLYTGVGSSWTECRLRVASVAALPGGGTNITMAEPGFTLARNRYFGQGVDFPASIANLYALLGPSSPGQYYLNSVSRTIYYVPRAGEDLSSADVRVPGAVETLLRAAGVSTAASLTPANFLAFEGLTFAYAGWLAPNHGEGYVDMQSGFRVLPTSTSDDDTWVPVPAAVRLRAVENVTISGCSFHALGATALDADDSSQSVVVKNCSFVDVSCGGVYVGQVCARGCTRMRRFCSCTPCISCCE